MTASKNPASIDPPHETKPLTTTEPSAAAEDSAQPQQTKVKMETIEEDVVVASLETEEPEPSSDSITVKSRQKTDFFQTETQVQTDTSKEPSQQRSAQDDTSKENIYEPQASTSQTQADTAPEIDSTESVERVDSAENDDLSEDNTSSPAQTHNQSDNQPLLETDINGEDNPQIDETVEGSHQQSGDAENSEKTTGSEEEEDDAQEDDAQEDDVQEEKEAKLESYKQFVAEQFSNQKVDYPEVRVRIEANALPSKMYFIMNTLSAIIASYGLVTNSAAVVIGAMLVAMMLGPITGVALAIIDHRMPLLRKSLITVIIGVSLVLVVGFMVGWLHKDQPLTAEILSRTQPTSMDLMIALAGGTAGAYAMVSPHLSVAVVGVAVATALVPPLAASGILFANGELQLGFGALLLAATNIIAIQFTNALVLWVLGFRRLVNDDYKSNTYWTFLQRNAITLLLLGGLGAYLTINLQTNAKQQGFESSVKEAINSYFIDQGNVLTNTQFDRSEENQVVRAVIRGETMPSSYDVRQIETIITQDMADNFPEYLPIKLQLRYLPVQVIESNPTAQDKLDKTDAAILTN